jgi:Asp/Glu/hydantoin racemase
MKTKIGCLHAHYSNIEYIQNAMASYEVELVHFVDPGLMSRIKEDKDFDDTKATEKVIEQIEWISQANVNAILITCTNYIALLEEDRLTTSIPIIKIDEPFFNYVYNITGPQTLLFTNPATVEGTMRRLTEYATAHGQPISNIEARVIENTFDLIMQGKKDQYAEVVSQYIRGLLEPDKNIRVSVAQLSMVEAAEKAECELGVKIGNPLSSLVTLLAHTNKEVSQEPNGC